MWWQSIFHYNNCTFFLRRRHDFHHLTDLDKANVTLLELYAMAETVCVETQSRFVLWDEEGKFVVHSDCTSSFCYYTLFGSFPCTFNYHAGLGKHCWCQKFAITMSSVCFILWSSRLKYPLVRRQDYPPWKASYIRLFSIRKYKICFSKNKRTGIWSDP